MILELLVRPEQRERLDPQVPQGRKDQSELQVHKGRKAIPEILVRLEVKDHLGQQGLQVRQAQQGQSELQAQQDQQGLQAQRDLMGQQVHKGLREIQETPAQLDPKESREIPAILDRLVGLDQPALLDHKDQQEREVQRGQLAHLVRVVRKETPEIQEAQVRRDPQVLQAPRVIRGTQVLLVVKGQQDPQGQTAISAVRRSSMISTRPQLTLTPAQGRFGWTTPLRMRRLEFTSTIQTWTEATYRLSCAR